MDGSEDEDDDERVELDPENMAIGKYIAGGVDKTDVEHSAETKGGGEAYNALWLAAGKGSSVVHVSRHRP